MIVLFQITDTVNAAAAANGATCSAVNGDCEHAIDGIISHRGEWVTKRNIFVYGNYVFYM